MWARMARADHEAESGTGTFAWVKALVKGGLRNFDFFSTHPASEKRVKVGIVTEKCTETTE